MHSDHTQSGFFVVWNPDGGPPRHRHARREGAKEEAMRLARENPGQQFYVLGSCGYARTVDVEWVASEHDDDIPF